MNLPKAMEKYLDCNRMISLEISNDPALRDVKITKNMYKGIENGTTKLV